MPLEQASLGSDAPRPQEANIFSRDWRASNEAPAEPCAKAVSQVGNGIGAAQVLLCDFRFLGSRVKGFGPSAGPLVVCMHWEGAGLGPSKGRSAWCAPMHCQGWRVGPVGVGHGHGLFLLPRGVVVFDHGGPVSIRLLPWGTCVRPSVCQVTPGAPLRASKDRALLPDLNKVPTAAVEGDGAGGWASW
jgi:hypothetical protein